MSTRRIRFVTAKFFNDDGDIRNSIGHSPTERPSADSIHKAWVRCAKAEEIVILNGLDSLKPELRPDILALARRRNVFVADADTLLGDWFAKHLPLAIQARHLRASLGDRDRIHVAIESLRAVAKRQISV